MLLKKTLFALSIYCLYVIGHNHLFLLGCGLIPTLFIPKKHVRHYILVISLAVILLTPNLYFDSGAFENHDVFLNFLLKKFQFNGNTISHNFVIMVGAVVLCFLIARMLRFFSHTSDLRLMFGFFLMTASLFTIATYLALDYQALGGIRTFLAFFIIATTLKLSWYTLMLFKDWNTLGGQSLLQHFIVPFWEPANYAREHLNLNYYFSTDEQERKLHVRGFYLIFRAMILFKINILLVNLFTNFILHHEGDLHYRAAFAQFANEYATHSISERWIFLLLYAFILYVNSFYIYIDIFIGLANLCGLSFQTSTHQPWRARTFADFWGRSAYYLNIIIINYFYNPIKKSFSSWKNKQLSKFTALFLGIFLGNVLIHYVKNASLIIMTQNPTGFLAEYFVDRMVYYFGLSLFIASSMTYTKELEGYIPGWLKLPAIWLLYSTLLSSIILSQTLGVTRIHLFYLSLFGL